MSEVATVEELDTRISCEICGAKCHGIQTHLKDDHADWTLARYEKEFPGKPLLSELAKMKLAEHQAAKKAAANPASSSVSTDSKQRAETKFFHEVFGLGMVPAALSTPSKDGKKKARPIPITTLINTPESQPMVPAIDPNYVFNLDVLKSVMLAAEMGVAAYLWGHAGTGKTSLFEQLFARTNRPMIRVQHTANMEESHIVGQWVLREGETVFELGPLPLAMINGWVYLADEYDFGRPEVLSVYQAVLEGKALVIKEADAKNRVIKPHPNFRFVATGNTNGTGDESGLYSGTNIQNAANYERFAIVERMPYMEPELEARLVSQQAAIAILDARKLVDYAGRIRTEFDNGKVTSPISPRSLIYAGKIGMIRANYRIGLEKAYINRLSSVDRETALQFAQRVFGA
jgi:cobaltochelatase CobS